RTHKLDALLAPTAGAPWVIDPVTGDHFGMSSSTLAAVAGTPAITVPAGFEHGLPRGVTFMGRAWDEGGLVRIAVADEAARRARGAAGGGAGGGLGGWRGGMTGGGGG